MSAADPVLLAAASRVYTDYARAVDTGDEPALRAILAAEVTIRRGGVDHPGLDAFLTVYRNSWSSGFLASKHYITNIQAERADDGTLRSRAYFNAVTVTADASTMVMGHYDDTLVAEDGEWRLSHKRITVEAAIPLPPSGAQYAGIPAAAAQA